MRSTIIILVIAVSSVLAQSSANFDLSENVIASGGGTSSGPTFTLIGSIGQPLAGTTSSSANFRLTGGFEGNPPLAPAAAPISISGTVRTASGVAIRGAFVTLVDAADGRQQMVTTGTFGIFRLKGIAGRTYLISVMHRRYQFADGSRLLDASADIDDLSFVSLAP